MESYNEYRLKEKAVISEFQKNKVLTQEPYSIETNVQWKKGMQRFEFDILIEFHGKAHAVVEIKMSLEQNRILDRAKDQINKAFELFNCPYGIITDGIDWYFCRHSTPTEYTQYNSLDDIIPIITESHSNFRTPPDQDKIVDCLVQAGLREFLNEEKSGFDYSIEDDFWKKLLGDETPNKVHRYTSLDTVFYMLKNGTYRMNGIVGMNDPSEIDYFDEYCYGSKKPSYKILNNLFLSSCSSLYDDLTMWRLYGEEAKGVCLTFEIKDDFSQDFLLQNISYANDKGKNNKLDLIKKLLKAKMVFNDIDKWKHFFKSKDYSIENEIRLLFMYSSTSTIVKGRDWIKTADHSIINPYVEFEIDSNEFPFKLTEILLGPKCPEKKTNEEQLKELIQQKEYSINVKSSSIKNYR